MLDRGCLYVCGLYLYRVQVPSVHPVRTCLFIVHTHLNLFELFKLRYSLRYSNSTHTCTVGMFTIIYYNLYIVYR